MKPGLAGIGVLLRNDKGKVILMFSKHVGVRDSNEEEMTAILEGSTCLFWSLSRKISSAERSANVIAYLTVKQGHGSFNFTLMKSSLLPSSGFLSWVGLLSQML